MLQGPTFSKRQKQKQKPTQFLKSIVKLVITAFFHPEEAAALLSQYVTSSMERQSGF